MKKYVPWEDFLNEKKLERIGEYNLHRNYKSIDGRFNFSTFPGAKGRIKKSLFNEKSIAKGITAYFACDYLNSICLRSKIKDGIDFKTEDLFHYYINFQYKFIERENEKKPSPLNNNELREKFLSKHLIDEKRKLDESVKYYDEVFSLNDKALKRKIFKYAEEYLIWVKSIKVERPKNLRLNKNQRIDNPNLHLSDILIPGISQKKVIKLYYDVRNIDDRFAFLTMFLRHLQDKGYYHRRVFLKELEIIGRNDFKKNYNLRRDHKPPIKSSIAYSSPPFSKIPEAEKFKI